MHQPKLIAEKGKQSQDMINSSWKDANQHESISYADKNCENIDRPV